MTPERWIAQQTTRAVRRLLEATPITDRLVP